MTRSSERWSDRAMVGVIGAAFILPLLFALYTGHVWEDFYITFRSSKNLAAGRGLVFQVGERVHTFTSPLGALVPAVCSFLAGARADSAAIWLFRLISAALLAATAAVQWRIARHLRLTAAGVTLLFGLFLLDPKIADFAMNGQETAFVLFFFTITAAALLTGPGPAWRLGLGLGGLMWSRPDGFIFAGALLAGFGLFVWSSRTAEEWRDVARWLGNSAVIAAVIYVPWFLEAWLYYGSPIPQPVMAKGAANIPHELFRTLLAYPFSLVAGRTWFAGLFLPAYYYFGGWPAELAAYSILLILPAVLYFLVPCANPAGRAFSFALFLGGAYLQIAPPEPWYDQVWQLLAMVVLSIAATDVLVLLSWLRSNYNISNRYLSGFRIAVGVLLAVQMSLWVGVALQMRINQTEIEDGNRRQIGIWLHDNAGPGDSVMLEPLGYIGFFSGLKMLDVPGLSAPEVTAAMKSGAQTWGQLITRLQPVWLVLRPSEIQSVQSQSPDLLNTVYQQARVFDVRARLNQYKSLPGAPYAYNDAVFAVYRRREFHNF